MQAALFLCAGGGAQAVDQPNTDQPAQPKNPRRTGKNPNVFGNANDPATAQQVAKIDDLLQQAAGARKGGKQAPGAKDPSGKKADPVTTARYAENAAEVLKLYQTAEAKYKEQQYREAASFYASVALADGSDPKVRAAVVQARARFVDMDGLAREHLKAADDAEMKRDYMKAVEELGVVMRDFPFTASCAEATQRLANLKGRKDVAGHVLLTEAETEEAAGNLVKACKLYQALAENPAYENSVPSLKAKRKLEALQKDDATKEQLKQAEQAQADKLAPQLLQSARNFMLNGVDGEAKVKLKTVIERFPGTKYAEEAQQELAKLK